ncbi:MAG: bifunctional 3-phosphoshikimate 1-carboxyvinyltransferase/cytidylate kinase [Comamonadaceae bacterium]|nr:bifunctional 3-phosphoshikimate 1-carboxyvinyltransferase/cytidylate kinase [Comamonadaceae bacterium]
MYQIDFLDLPALTHARGSVRLPGSKSISNRVLLLAALSAGETVVHDLLASDDTAVMLTALRQMGCLVEQTGHTLVITGLGGALRNKSAKLFLGNAGTAMRPLTAALALLGGDFELSGVPRMHERPIGDLVDALRQLGCSIDYLGQEGYPPLRLRPEQQFRLDAPIRVRGDVSSQFLTALLMALPLVARQDIAIEVVGELISRPYIEITLNLLQRFGIAVRREGGWQRFVIPAGSRYQSPGDIYVEGDASSASYFVALGAIAAIEQPIEILGIGSASIQGDIAFVQAAEQMGAAVELQPNSIRVQRGAWPLKAVDLDCNHIPDAAMTLAVMALYARGTTTLRNIASWRVKETDRLSAMACELRKLGATVEEGADFIGVTPPQVWKPASIATYDDHRIAMCFSLAAFNPAHTLVRIEEPHCVAKTFPDYFETLFEVSHTEAQHIPVICVDGPTASGKGTLAALTAQRLGFHYLDSGALYRVAALAAERAGVSLDDGAAVAAIARSLPLRFEADRVFLAGQDVSDDIRTEPAGMAASRVSVHPEVRAALTDLQRGFRRLPGLVTDGRDMGTVIFADATLKVFLTASAARRAQRRHKQLISKGISVTLAAIESDLKARDERDSSRSTAPLKPAQDALLLDNSELSIESSIEQLLLWWQGKRPT